MFIFQPPDYVIRISVTKRAANNSTSTYTLKSLPFKRRVNRVIIKKETETQSL